MERRQLVDLHRILSTRFNRGELQTLCFYLGIDYDTLPEGGLADKARELVAYCVRHERIGELVGAGKQLRPDISWPALPSAVKDPSTEVPTSAVEEPGSAPPRPGDVFITGDVHGDVVTGHKTTLFDQRGQTVDRQTNVAGNWTEQDLTGTDDEEK